jgi:dephospho-CoA kinase
MIVGLTGGIGSGKSMVARIFEILGCAVFNSDLSAKSVYFDPSVRRKVIELLGEKAYAGDKLDKKYISTIIFNDTDLLHRLNEIIHPAVGNDFKKFIEHNRGKIIIKESALLFEARLTAGLDKTIVVAADDELRIKRVMTREGISRAEVVRKMKSQLGQDQKIKLCDYLIMNNEKEFLITQTLDIYNKLQTIMNA